MRRKQFDMISGFAVIAIPDSGIFVRDGRVVTGDGIPMVADELTLFKRRADAQVHADQQTEYWAKGDDRGHHWHFLVLPVLVSERM